MKTGLEKMESARAALIQTHVFFGMLSMRLKLVEDSSIETANVNGTELRFNPTYVESLTMNQTIGLFSHEIMHCALGHIWRLKNRDSKRWNIAADNVVNHALTSEGFELPEGALIDAQYKDMSADEIYAKMAPEPDDQQGNSGGAGNDFGGCGEMVAPSSDSGNGESQEMTQAEMAALADEWNMATAQAETIAKAAGKDPSNATNATKASRRAVVDWRTILRRFIASASPDNYSWCPPNRRFVAQDIYLPSLVPDKLGEIIVIRDTSGSTAHAQGQFLAELNDIISEVKPALTRVIDCDSAIGNVAEYGPDESIPETYCGGGGTSFKPPFDLIESESWNPVCAIYLTDLEPGDGYPSEPSYPVLWVSCARNADTKAPFGDTVWMAPSA